VLWVLQREGLLCREGVVVVVIKREREREILLKVLEMGQKNL